MNYPDEADLPMWKTIAERSQPADLSPYIAWEAMMRIWGRHFDQVVLGTKEPERATRDAAREIDAEIQANVTKEPSLQRLWNATEARG
ncbi:hypothetical protein BH11ARM2_BH11ARM2_18730 [soil metagenome]